MATTATSTTRTLNVTGIGPVEVTVEERGDGHPVLVLHGDAGPQSVSTFAELLVQKGGSRILTPTHPGFGGTPRPDPTGDPRARAPGNLRLGSHDTSS
jgi:pimeloyl-ACP methyl ester carboxylesterase